MKNLMYCLLALTTFTFFSCQKDNLPAKTKNLVGIWEVDSFNYIQGQDDVQNPDISIAETGDGTPFRLELNDDDTFTAFGDKIILIGTYTAKRLKGEYADGEKFRHGDLAFSFDPAAGTYPICDGALVSLLREVDEFTFNGKDLTIYSKPAADEAWSKSVIFEKR